MKKYLVILLSVLFVLSTFSFVIADDGGMDSVRAMAPGAKVVIGGDARVRGIWFKNADFTADDDNDNRYYDQRIRLKFKGEAGNGISGNLRLYVSNSPKWDGATNTACTGCILVDYAYITIPVSSLTVNAGLQKLWFGNNLYLADERFDAILVSGSFNNVKVTALTLKLDDTLASNGTDNLKDFNSYGVILVANINDIEAGAFIHYLKDDRTTTPDAVDSGIDIALYANAAVSGIDVGGEINILTGDMNKTAADKTPMGLMLFAKTTVGAIGVRADFGLSRNTFTANNNYQPTLLIGTDANTALFDFSSYDDKTAWIISASANTDVMTDVNVLGRVGYASSKNPADDSESFFELDGVVTVTLAKNAKYTFEAGYMNPNDEIGPDSAIVVANRAELWF